MPDIRRAVELAAKALRGGFSCLGAGLDVAFPLKPVFGHPLPNPTTPAAGAGAGQAPEVVSGPPAATSGVLHGVPTFAVLKSILTDYAVDHGELRFDGTADHWSCQCGQSLPDDGDGAYAALRDHCTELQASALSFAIAEARNTQSQK